MFRGFLDGREELDVVVVARTVSGLVRLEEGIDSMASSGEDGVRGMANGRIIRGGRKVMNGGSRRAGQA